MPRGDNDIGLGDESEHKYRDFAGLCSMIANIGLGALRNHPRWPRPFLWMDLTSGPGLHPLPDGRILNGTPTLAMDALREASARLGEPFHAIFLEQRHANFVSLEKTLAARYGQAGTQYQVIEGNSEVLAEEVLKHAPAYDGLGVIVYDPTEAVDFDLLARLVHLPKRERFDLLVYVSATSIKRPRNLPARYQTDRRTLIERMATCDKSAWIVRKRAGTAEWTWMLGTQHVSMPAWRKSGFENWTSPDGKRILRDLDMTREERQHEAQTRMEGFFDE
jgi:hypothetical protein